MGTHSYPSGFLTFLFTDIQGSTPLWEQDPVGMGEALELHNEALYMVIEAHAGRVFKIVGDEFQVVFEDPLQAVQAAVAAQRALVEVAWGRVGPLQVRMGIHSGPAEWQGSDYAVSHTFNRTARIMSSGHGGQILLSGAVLDQVDDQLPPDVSLRDMGRLRMKGMTLREHLFQVIAPALAADFPPLKTVEAGQEEPLIEVPQNLPLATTPFVGRDNELNDLEQWIADPALRLLTILGPGGMGKTRLALACGQQLAEPSGDPPFPNGIFFVDLAPLSDPSLIIPTMAKSLQFPLHDSKEEGRSAQEQLLDYLREKQLLLLLDNFEHLLPSTNGSAAGSVERGSVNLVSDILQNAPKVQLIVTSRERLRLRQEQVYPIQGLEFPDWETPEDAEEYTAVQLFLQSARRNQPDFQLEDGDDLTYLARICRLVAGMPLAIELAAAWVDMLTLEEIAGDLMTQDGRGLDLLETDFHDVPERQQSVRATIDYSWQKLNDKEQRSFAQLAIFRGGFTRRAGQKIAKAPLPLLARLVKKSLLQFNKRRKRYQVHALLRQYGMEKLAEYDELETAVRDRHAAYYCRALGSRTDDLQGGRQKKALAEIESDIDNARAAWDWAVEQKQMDLLDQAVFSLCRFYDWYGRLQEYRQFLDTALKPLDVSPMDLRQRLLVIDLLHHQAEQAATLAIMQESLERAENQFAGLEEAEIDYHTQQARHLLLQGELQSSLGEYQRAANLYQQSIHLYDLLDRRWEKSRALLSLGELNANKGHLDQAENNIQKALSIAHTLNDRATICLAFSLLAVVANNRGNLKQLQQFTQRSITIARELGLRYRTAVSLVELGTVKMVEAQYSEAEQLHQESISLLVDMGYRRDAALAMCLLGLDKLGARQVEEALQWINKSLDLSQEIGDFRTVSFCFFSLSIIGLIEGKYDEALSYAKEARLSAPGNAGEVIGSALVALGWSYLVTKEYTVAKHSLYKALQQQLYVSEWAYVPIVFLLMKCDPAAITLEEAWQLIGNYEESFLGRMPLFNEFSARFQPEQLLTLPKEQIEAAKEIGRSLDMKSIDAELIPKLAALGWGEI